MHALTLVLALVAGLWGIALVGVLLDLAAAKPLHVTPPPPDAPEVAVVVPARNEAHQIAACLRSLLAQKWPRLRVICVDDRSDDGTFEAASEIRDERLIVVRGRELPAGWLGKNYANVQGMEHAGSASWLLFTDADTLHAPDALPSAMAAAQGADLLTILGDLTMVSFWERALLPHVLANIVTFFQLRRVNDPKSKMAIANGQYLLLPRTAYEAIGGHTAIRDRVADDLELARLIKGSGRVLRAVLGRHLYSVRMYTSFRQIWWGFVKNASAGAGGGATALLGAVFTLLCMLPFYALPFLHGLPFYVALIGALLALAQRAFIFWRIFPAGGPYVLLMPFSQALFAGILVHSGLRQLTGKGPVWKGRAYPHGR